MDYTDRRMASCLFLNMSRVWEQGPAVMDQEYNIIVIVVERGSFIIS